jgi:hypothetical protein
VISRVLLHVCLARSSRRNPGPSRGTQRESVPASPSLCVHSQSAPSICSSDAPSRSAAFPAAARFRSHALIPASVHPAARFRFVIPAGLPHTARCRSAAFPAAAPAALFGSHPLIPAGVPHTARCRSAAYTAAAPAARFGFHDPSPARTPPTARSGRLARGLRGRPATPSGRRWHGPEALSVPPAIESPRREASRHRRFPPLTIAVSYPSLSRLSALLRYQDVRIQLLRRVLPPRSEILAPLRSSAAIFGNRPGGIGGVGRGWMGAEE